MKATDISWEFDLDDELIATMPLEEVASVLGTTKSNLLSYNTEGIKDFIEDRFHHQPGIKDDFANIILNLPLTEEIPADIEEDEVADYLSDKYGYLIESLSIEPTLDEEKY